MIFICVGSREYQFDRLLIKLDKLIENKIITETVFAQIGQSTYIPRNYTYTRFLSDQEFKEKQKNADLIISHGGTGALIGALKMDKQVIAVPRLSKYGEHTDDHQLQVSSVLDKAGYLKMVEDLEELADIINDLKFYPITKKYDRPSKVFETIASYIERDVKSKF